MKSGISIRAKALVCAGALAVTVPLAVAFSGGVAADGEPWAQNRIVGRQGVTTADVTIEMKTGDLALGAGEAGLLSGSFRSNVAAGKPRLAYDLSAGVGTLRLDQETPDGIAAPWDRTEASPTWDLRLHPDVALDLRVDAGDGSSRLDLGDLTVATFGLDAGDGDVLLDLTDSTERNLTAQIRTGDGSLVIALPDDIGVRIETSDEATIPAGFVRNGDAFVNALHGRSAVTVTVALESGDGEVEFVSEKDPRFAPRTESDTGALRAS